MEHTNLYGHKPSAKVYGLLTRILSALLLLPIVLFAFWVGGLFFYLFSLVILWLLAYEWNVACGGWSFSIDGMAMVLFLVCAALSSQMHYFWLAFTFYALGLWVVYMMAMFRGRVEKRKLSVPINRVRYMVFGMFYFGLFAIAFPYIRTLDSYGRATLLWLFFTVVAVDTFAYFVGSSIGRFKILPSISPNKTWEGFIAGMFGAVMVAFLTSIYLPDVHLLSLIILAPFMTIIAHMGDFLESYFKRRLGLKDMGTLIPGHGGVFDRLDALIFTTIVIALISLILGKSFILISIL